MSTLPRRPQELLLSKLLRTATLTGRNTQELVEDFLASYQSQAIPAVPQQQGPMARAPAAADAAPPAGGGATGSGAQAAAGVAASGGGGEGGEGEGEDGTAAPQFKAAEARLMRHLATLRKDREVQLPLDRAQTVLRWADGRWGWRC